VKNSSNGISDNIDAGFKRLGLTSREIQILRQLALGKVDRQISIELKISVKTVNHHVSKIILKLEAVNRTHAVAKALVDKHIEMRTADTPIRILDRRLGEQGKMARAILSNVPESADCEAVAG
jgi:DNA-binding CsgD family transcriptional regulator